MLDFLNNIKKVRNKFLEEYNKTVLMTFVKVVILLFAMFHANRNNKSIYFFVCLVVCFFVSFIYVRFWIETIFTENFRAQFDIVAKLFNLNDMRMLLNANFLVN